MSRIAHKKTSPMPIQKLALKKTEQYIGTCSSYDEQQPVPSFVRSLPPSPTSAELVNANSLEKDREDTSVPSELDSQKCSRTTVET